MYSLQLLLVAEVEEKREEEGQEQSWWSREQRSTWRENAHVDGHDANVSMDKMYEACETMRARAHSVNVLVSVLNVQCHASGEVRCSVFISVVFGICLIELSVPLVQFYFTSPFSLLVVLLQFIQLFPVAIPSHMFSLYSHGMLGVVFTLSSNSSTIFRQYVPYSLWTVFADTVLKWPLSLSKSSRVQRYEFGICQTFFLVVFRSKRNIIEHRHKYDSSSEILWYLIYSQQ